MHWRTSTASQYENSPVHLVNDQPGLYRLRQPWSSDAAGFGGASYYLNGMVVPGENGVPHGVVTNDYNTLQPRIGFSYDSPRNGKTVLRGGFGTFYERLQGNDIYGLANSNLPYEYTPLRTTFTSATTLLVGIDGIHGQSGELR